MTSCPFRQKINLIGLIFGKGDIRVTHALVPRGYKYIYNLYAEGEAFGTYMWKAATEFQEKGYYVGYSPLTPNLSYVIETEWIYQLNSQAQRNVRHYSFLTNKDPYRELEAIFKDWYIKDKKDNPKKRMASDKNLDNYIDEVTLARIYQNFGMSWGYLSRACALDVGKFEDLDDIFKFRDFILRKFKIRGTIAKGVDK